MRKFILCIGAIITATSLNAQINVGANFLVGLPSGGWNDPQFVSTAFGGSIEGNYFVMDNLSVGLEIGFNSFGEYEENLVTMTQMPITVKAEYYFLDDDIRPFAGLGVGYYLVAQNIDGEKFADVNGLGISPRVGAIYQVSDMIGLVLNVNYNLLFGQKVDGEGDTIEDATNFIGIGIGARFTLVD